MGTGRGETRGLLAPPASLCLTSWLCWLWASVPKPSGGILTSVRGLFFLLLQPPPPPTAEDYTRLQLSMGGSLPGRRPAPGHPVQPGEQIAKALESSLLVGPHAAMCDAASSRGDSGFVLGFFSPPWPLSLFVASGGFLPDNSGFRVEVSDSCSRSSLGGCRAVQRRPGETSALSVRRGTPEGCNSLEGIWLFLFTRRMACPLSPSVHFWDYNLQKFTGAQSSKYKGSRQRKQICPKAHN